MLCGGRVGGCSDATRNAEKHKHNQLKNVVKRVFSNLGDSHGREVEIAEVISAHFRSRPEYTVTQKSDVGGTHGKEIKIFSYMSGALFLEAFIAKRLKLEGFNVTKVVAFDIQYSSCAEPENGCPKGFDWNQERCECEDTDNKGKDSGWKHEFLSDAATVLSEKWKKLFSKVHLHLTNDMRTAANEDFDLIFSNHPQIVGSQHLWQAMAFNEILRKSSDNEAHVMSFVAANNCYEDCPARDLLQFREEDKHRHGQADVYMGCYGSPKPSTCVENNIGARSVFNSMKFW
eukprot:g3169.t1